MGPMNTVITRVRILLIMVGLRDMFHQLLHPPSHSSLSCGVFSVVWRMSRVMKHRLGTAVGPGAMVLVIVLWVLLQVFGWALVYLPHVPEDFSYSDADPTRYPDFADALYVSLVTLATLGFGDVVAVDPVLRLVTPLQGLTGFALLTPASPGSSRSTLRCRGICPLRWRSVLRLGPAPARMSNSAANASALPFRS